MSRGARASDEITNGVTVIQGKRALNPAVRAFMTSGSVEPRFLTTSPSDFAAL